MVERARRALDRLLAGDRAGDPLRRRDAAVLGLLESGLSVAEVAGLRRGDLELGGGPAARPRVRLPESERRSTTVQLTRRAAAQLAAYLAAGSWRDGRERLFTGRRARRLSESGIRSLLRRRIR